MRAITHRRLESGQQLGCADVKQFLLSCGRPEVGATADGGAGIDEDAKTDMEGMGGHAKMALSLLRRLRLQRCHYQIFSPFPAETSSLFIRACIRSGDALIGTFHNKDHDKNSRFTRAHTHAMNARRILFSPPGCACRRQTATNDDTNASIINSRLTGCVFMCVCFPF